MNQLVHFMRMLQRNLKWMFLLSILTASVVYWFTRNMPHEYQSETEIFTGITSGLSIENVEGAKMDFFAANNAFDNLINIIQSRQTKQEVGMRLLAQHLLIDTPKVDILSEESYADLHQWMGPATIEKLRVEGDTEATYQNVVRWYQEDFYSDEVSLVLNSGFSPYSDKAINAVRVNRLQNSDLIRINYTWKDPAIAQQTLALLNEVFIRLVAEVKVAQTSDIVSYFLEQVKLAEDRLNGAEQQLEEFRTENRVINYGEQTKSISMMKEYMEDEYQKELASRASAQAAVSRLETQLSVNKEMLQYSESLLEKRAELAEINSQIAVLEVYLNDAEELTQMRRRADQLSAEISRDLFNRMEYSRTTEGVPVTTLLNEWLESTLSLDRINARIRVFENRKVYFNELYDEFSVVGSVIGRYEREIGIEEKNYLELLHSLNLALMRLSSETLASDGLQVTVQPFFPLSPLPSKRFLLVALSFIVAFILPFVVAILKDLLDLSIKTGERLASFSSGSHVGSIPKASAVLKQTNIDATAFRSQYMRLIWARIEKEIQLGQDGPVILSVMSLRPTEGKSYVCEQLHSTLESQGLKALHLQPGKGKYVIDEYLKRVEFAQDLTEENINGYDVVLLEVPALLEQPYPDEVVKRSHLQITVAWAGRIWNKADSRKLDDMSLDHRLVLLNGADLEEMESVLGDLPKRRNAFRRYLKKLVQFQFKSSVATA